MFHYEVKELLVLESITKCNKCYIRHRKKQPKIQPLTITATQNSTFNIIIGLNQNLILTRRCSYKCVTQQGSPVSTHPHTNSPDWSPYISFKNSWENLVWDQSILPLVINLVILITFTLDDLLMMLGENWFWSLLGPKGLTRNKWTRGTPKHCSNLKKPFLYTKP